MGKLLQSFLAAVGLMFLYALLTIPCAFVASYVVMAVFTPIKATAGATLVILMMAIVYLITLVLGTWLLSLAMKLFAKTYEITTFRFMYAILLISTIVTAFMSGSLLNAALQMLATILTIITLMLMVQSKYVEVVQIKYENKESL